MFICQFIGQLKQQLYILKFRQQIQHWLVYQRVRNYQWHHNLHGTAKLNINFKNVFISAFDAICYKLEQQWNIETMSNLIPQAKTIGEAAIRHVQDFIRLRKAVHCLYNKAEAGRMKQADLKNIASPHNSPQNSKIDEYQKCQQVKDLILSLREHRADFMYYQRDISKQCYERVTAHIIKNIELVCKDGKHSFYSARKEQVQLIQNVVAIFNLIFIKLNDYLNQIKTQCPSFILNDIQKCIQIAQKIKFEKKPQALKTKYYIKFSFPSPKFQKSQQKNKINTRPETSKKSHAATNVTTRPSSGYKQSLDVSKLKKRWNNSTQPISFYEQYQIKNIIQQKTETAQKTPRCQTARVRNNYQKIIINRKYKQKFQQQRIDNKSGVEHSLSCDKSKILQSLQDINNNSQQSIKKSISQGRVTNFIQRITPKNSVSQLTKPLPRKHRKGAIKMSGTRDVSDLKFTQKQIEKIQKNLEKPQKMSQNLAFNESMKLHMPIRKFQSHQNMILQSNGKPHKRFRNNQAYKKKNHMHKNRNMTKITQIAQPVQQINGQQLKHPTILLIKAPVESRGHHHRNQPGFLLNKPGSAVQRDLLKRFQSQKQGQFGDIHRQNNDIAQMSNSEQKSNVENMVNVNDLKVGLGEINCIRSEFIKARWQNRIIGADDKQNSIFFIEQGFLNHRQNMKFQRYLQQLKDTCGLSDKKQPFPIETGISELNNQRLVQLQRCYTFRGEAQWIKHRFGGIQQQNKFTQIGFRPLEANQI